MLLAVHGIHVGCKLVCNYRIGRVVRRSTAVRCRDFFRSDDESVSDEGGADSPAGEEQGAEEAHLVSEDWSSDEEAGVQETAVPAVPAAAEHLPDVDVTEEEISAMQGILDKGCGCATPNTFDPSLPKTWRYTKRNL